jgi:hypothetical protein
MKAMQASVVAARPLVLQAGGEAYLEGVKAAAGLVDGHTEKSLAALDHPYARRHGSIQETKLGHPGWWVHRQTGRLFRSIKGQMNSATEFSVFADTNIAPHAEAVINGTSVMLPRDFIWIAGELRVVRRRIMRAMVRVLGKQLRTKAHIRFGDPGIPGSIPDMRDSSGGTI